MLSFKKPTFVLNSDICRQNIKQMTKKATKAGVIFRPHFKTHQSAEVGEWFREEGVTRITVSSVTMATYFAHHGWKDITIAFPVNQLEIEEINKLAAAIKLNLLFESVESAQFLSEKLTSNCGFFIKIDTGYHRVGIEYSDIALIEKVLDNSKSIHLTFKGFLAHFGNTYNAKNTSEISHIQSFAIEKLLNLKTHFLQRYPDLLISIGDTPSCSILPIPETINEIRPGNFAFFDLMQNVLGSCQSNNIAVGVLCPVVATHLERNEAVIYGGAVHLSKECISLNQNSEPVYGLVIAWNDTNWETNTILGTIKKVSQEHGIISLSSEGLALKPGDVVCVVPVHSCLTANQFNKYYTIPDGKWIEVF